MGSANSIKSELKLDFGDWMRNKDTCMGRLVIGDLQKFQKYIIQEFENMGYIIDKKPAHIIGESICDSSEANLIDVLDIKNWSYQSSKKKFCLMLEISFIDNKKAYMTMIYIKFDGIDNIYQKTNWKCFFLDHLIPMIENIIKENF